MASPPGSCPCLGGQGRIQRTFASLNACMPAAGGDGTGLLHAIRVQTSAACTNRMRRTSSMAYGFDCTECVERTIYSESTPSRCELEYSTTPSLLPSTGPFPATAMIECVWTSGAIGVAAIV